MPKAKNLNRYRVAGVAFDGDKFDYEVESKSTMFDFLIADITELTGGDLKNAYVHWVRGNKALIEGTGRLYLIEQLNYYE